MWDLLKLFQCPDRIPSLLDYAFVSYIICFLACSTSISPDEYSFSYQLSAFLRIVFPNENQYPKNYQNINLRLDLFVCINSLFPIISVT